MRFTVWRTLLLASAISLVGVLAGSAPAATPVVRRAVPTPQVMLARPPMNLEVQITAEHWQKDIHIPERWSRELRTVTRSTLLFRVERPALAPHELTYVVYRGALPAEGSRTRAVRPFASGSIGAPPPQGGTKEFEIDFSAFLPAEPNGSAYFVRLVGPAPSGEGTKVWSNSVRILYAELPGTEFGSPTLTRIIGTPDPYGNGRTWNDTPLAATTQVFRLEGKELWETPATTTVQFLQDGQIVQEVSPAAEETHALPSGEVSLGVVTHWNLKPGLYRVRVKTGMGETKQLPLYVCGREDYDNQFVGYVSNEEDRFVDYVGGFREEFMGTWTNTQYFWGEARFLKEDRLTRADSADLCYLAGHGNASYIKVNSSEGVKLWETAFGSHASLDHTGDLEYIVFHSCTVLKMDSGWRDRWRHTAATSDEPRPFSGLHMAMGFRTKHHNGANAGWWAADEFAENLEDGYNVRYAWYEAAEDARPLAGYTDNKPAIFYLRPHRYEKISQHNTPDYHYGDPDYLLDVYYMQ